MAPQNMCKNYDGLKLKTNKSKGSSPDYPFTEFYVRYMSLLDCAQQLEAKTRTHSICRRLHGFCCFQAKKYTSIVTELHP